MTPARLRTVVVDDEGPARALLCEYLTGHDDIEVVAECQNGFEAVKTVTELRPDLLFLDVQMPKLDGFEVLELLASPPVVIFVTAFDEYALRAFGVHAVDYLLKPCDPERLNVALERARARLGQAAPPPPAVPAATLAAAARPAGRFLERIIVKDHDEIHVIPVSRLDYLEARDDQVLVRAEGREHLKAARIADLEAALDPRRFVRIHRGYVLNLDRLARLETYAKDSRSAVLRDGSRLPVSRAGYARLRELM